jgi:hypothetical protein
MADGTLVRVTFKGDAARSARCAVCGETVKVTSKGRLAAHRGGDGKCAGGGKPPGKGETCS